jgi:hypothetical protein
MLNLSMETVTIYIRDDQEKKVLLAFLHRQNYNYKIESDEYFLTDEQVKEMVKRKSDFLAGITTSRPLIEIKEKHEGV